MGETSYNKAAKIAGYFFVIYYAVGAIGLTLPTTRETFTGLMPLSILLSVAILLFFHRKWRSTEAIILFFIALTGYLIEVLGVYTGHIFGVYEYGDALGFSLFGTPLIIGVNWMMLIYCVYAIMEDTRMFWPLKALTAAVLMVAYDVVMEPVAVRLDMWSWPPANIVPVQNYQAWFIISLVFLAAMHLGKVNTRNRVAPWLFGVQFAFFLLLNFTLRIF